MMRRDHQDNERNGAATPVTSKVSGVQGLAASVVLIAILLGVLLLVAFDVFCLVHLAAADRARFLPKWAWAVFIVCVSPIGGAAYLVCQRQRQPKRSPDPPVPLPRAVPR
jgi:membrane protein implicated in regulation of membrane protease activity